MLILSEILSSKWLLDPTWAQSYYPLVFNLLQGKQISREEIEEAKKLVKTPYLISKVNGVYNISEFGEESSPEDAPDDSIAVFPLMGVIRKNDGCFSAGTRTKANLLRRAAENPKIKSIIIHADSGGGEASGTEHYAATVKEVSKIKPVIAFVDLSASACYWAIANATKIIANGRTAEIGSIGTYVSWADFTAYYEAMGIKVNTIYAPQSTEKNKSFRDVQEHNDDTLMKKELGEFNQIFIDAIQKARGSKLDLKAGDPFKGGLYLAETALKIGLIDEIGNFDAAVTAADMMGNEAIETRNLSNFNTNMKLSLKSTWAALIAFFGAKAATGSESVEAEVSAEQLEQLNADLSQLNSLKESNASLTAEKTDLAAKLESAGTAKAAADARIKELESEVKRLGSLTAALPTAGIRNGSDDLGEAKGGLIDPEADHNKAAYEIIK